MFLAVKGFKKKKKKRLGFDLVLRASFHLTITIRVKHQNWTAAYETVQ